MSFAIAGVQGCCVQFFILNLRNCCILKFVLMFCHLLAADTAHVVVVVVDIDNASIQ